MGQGRETVRDGGLEARAADIQEGFAIQARQVHAQLPALQQALQGPRWFQGSAQAAGQTVAAAAGNHSQGDWTTSVDQSPAGMVDRAVAPPYEQGTAGPRCLRDRELEVPGRTEGDGLHPIPQVLGQGSQQRIRILGRGSSACVEEQRQPLGLGRGPI